MKGSKSAGDPNPRLGSSKSASVFGWGIQIRGDPNPRLHMQQRNKNAYKIVDFGSSKHSKQPDYAIFLRIEQYAKTEKSQIMRKIMRAYLGNGYLQSAV